MEILNFKYKKKIVVKNFQCIAFPETPTPIGLRNNLKIKRFFEKYCDQEFAILYSL